MPFNFGTSLDPAAVISASYGASSAVAARENRVNSLQARQRAAMQQAEIMAQQANHQASLASHEAMAGQQMMDNEADRRYRLQSAQFNAAADRQRQIDMAMLGYQIDSTKARDSFANQVAIEKMRRDEMKSMAMDANSQRSDLEMRDWYLKQSVPPGESGIATKDQISPYIRKPETDVPDFVDGPMQGYVRALDNDRIAQLPFKIQTEKLMQGIQRGDPNAIREGMSRGLVKFTEQQQNDYNKLQSAMYKVDNDPSLRPNERAYAQRQIAEKLARIRPVPTLPHQQQPTIDEQIAQKIRPYFDRVTGKQRSVTIDRHGDVKGLFDDEKKAETKNSAADEYKREQDFHRRYLETEKQIAPIGEKGEMLPVDRELVIKKMKEISDAYKAVRGVASDSDNQSPSGALQKPTIEAPSPFRSSEEVNATASQNDSAKSDSIKREDSVPVGIRILRKKYAADWIRGGGPSASGAASNYLDGTHDHYFRDEKTFNDSVARLYSQGKIKGTKEDPVPVLTVEDAKKYKGLVVVLPNGDLVTY